MARTRTLLISGASRGIGRAIAERALADGHRLSLGVRDPASLLDTPLGDAARKQPEKVRIDSYDATDPASAEAWVKASREHFRLPLTADAGDDAFWKSDPDGPSDPAGAVDAVIHCAGIFSRVGLLFGSGEEAELQRLWDVNVMGPWWLTRAAWPDLIRSGEGRIIVLVSMSGKRVKGTLAGYGASKFALMGLCQAMRNQGWNDGIRVTAICPGWVNTDMASAVQALPAEAMTQPEDLASLVSQLLRLPNAAVPFELGLNCVLEA